MRKVLLIAGLGVVAGLAGACADDPYYYGYGDQAYYSSHYGYRHPYTYDKHVSSIVVENTAPVVVSPPPTATRYRVTVRSPNGFEETYYMDSLGGLKVGDRVRVANGRIYPLG